MVWSKGVGGGTPVYLGMVRGGGVVVATPWNGGRSVKLRMGDGEGAEEVGPGGAWGVAVTGGGRRVVTSHSGPSRYVVSGGGRERAIAVDGYASCVAFVEGGGGLLARSGNDVVLIR